MQRFVWETRTYTAEELTQKHVRLVTVVRLPFHLCTGRLLRIDDPDTKHLHLWLRNRLTIAPNLSGHEAMLSMDREVAQHPKHYATEAYIVNASPTLRDGEFEAIKEKKYSGGGIGWPSPTNPGFHLLNHVIAAHQMVRIGPYISSGLSDWPGMIPLREMFSRVVVEIVLLCEPDQDIDESLIERMIESIDKLPRGEYGGSMGALQDFTTDQLKQMSTSISKIRRHAYYELAMSAISAMLAGDGRVALILACAALEGSHATFVRLHLRGAFSEQSSSYNKLVSGILRDQGFHALLQLTTRVFLPPARRPNSDQIEGCLAGIEIRNAIMHATISGSGEYKMRKLSETEINNGYSGLLAMYRVFVDAVEEVEAND